MKINVYPICSALHDHSVVMGATSNLLQEMKGILDCSIEIVDDISKLYESDLALVLVQSGGSEGTFIKDFPKLHGPIYLLTLGSNNSLAASLEILSYLNQEGVKGEILHGSTNYICSRIKEITKDAREQSSRLGVIGVPSDWLIASLVDYNKVLNTFNIELVDISIDRLIKLYEEIDPNDVEMSYKLDKFSTVEIDKAKKIYGAIKAIIKDENIEGLTIRCFALLETIKSTSCLALALLNSEGIIGTCEGDVPSMISMYLLNKWFKSTGFQCNPSRIDTDNNAIVLAHCTLPLSMCQSYHLDTHFESGIGLGVKGELEESDVTIFKISNDLKRYFVAEGKIVKNLNERTLCRTQIYVQCKDDIKTLLKNPCGNHQIVIYGHHAQEIRELMKSYIG